MFGSTFHASVAQSAAAIVNSRRESSSSRPLDDAPPSLVRRASKLTSSDSLEDDDEQVDDAFELADAYGSDAAARLSKILLRLERAGFAKARANEWSAFDRILSGVAWTLQQIVKREDSAAGRVQWDALFQSHAKMKPRLGFAQEVVKRIEALPYACPVHIQPHQLLLQDFGDIGAVHRIVSWLIDQQQNATPHLDAIRKHHKYQDVILSQEQQLAKPKPLKKDVVYLQRAFQPRRKWQYMSSDDWKSEPEDALIQRCLLEYGERVCVAVLDDGSKATSGGTESVGVDSKPPNLMAQLASQAAAAATAGATRPGSAGRKGRASSKRFVDPQAADFEIQYQKAMKQAIAEQQEQLNKQKEREIQLLQQVVSAPEQPEGVLGSSLSAASAGSSQAMKARSSAQLEQERAVLQEHETQVQQLIEEKRVLEARTQEAQDQATAVSQAIANIEQEMAQLDVKEAQNTSAQPFLATLKKLVVQNETLKRQKTEFRVKCRTELEKLHARIAQLKQQAEEDLANQDEETLRLNEIEQMHAQMAAKHKEMKVALAKQTREIQLKMRKIDEVPTRIELIQYEKRFLELYEEVALTLDETRKYYCTYNTLKTTQEFLEKEISLINSIHENFDVAMGSKAATQAFFTQLEGIIQNVQGTVAKQQGLRADHQANVETLDSKYQLLLEKERTYVNAIREFQKECEKNERLSAKLVQLQSQAHHQMYQQPGKEATSATGEDAAECSNASRSSAGDNDDGPASASLESPQLMMHPAKDKKDASIFTFLEAPTTSRRCSTLPSSDAPSASRESQNAPISESSKLEQVSDHQDERVSSGFTNADAADEALGTAPASQESEDAAARDAGDAHMDRQKPVPIRKNYRSKLGNRVWWELQCAAEKLLQQQPLEPAKRGNHSKPQIISKKECSVSKTRAERKATAIRSPIDKESALNQRRNSQRASDRSEGNTSICEVRCVPHPASPKSTPAATVTRSTAPRCLPEHPQALLSPQCEAIFVQITHAVSGSTKRVFLPERVAEPEFPHVGHAEIASHSIARKEKETPRTTTTVSTCRSSSSRRSVPPGGADQAHTPLFTKTTLFQQDLHEPASNHKSQSTANDTPAQHAHFDALSQDVDTTASKSGALLQSAAAHSVRSRTSVLSPHEYDYDADDHIRTPSTAMHAPNAHTPHVKHSHSRPKWYADARDSMTLHGDDDDDDDDDLVKNQWASTRTSYAVEREARQAIANNDEQQQQQRSHHFPLSAPSRHQQEPEAKAKVAPFNVHGRVPIRSNCEVPLSRQPPPPRFEADGSSSDEEDDTICPVNKKQNQAALKVGAVSAADYPAAKTKQEKDDEEEDVEEEDVFRPRNAETTRFQPMAATAVAAIDRRAPHVATFITIDVDSSKRAPHHDTSSSTKLQSHEEKLAELRQKKLQQLHKTRAEQQQQKKEKLLRTKSNLAAQAALDDGNNASTPMSASSTTTTATTSHLRAAKKPSNRKLIQNALEYTLLTGFSMAKERNAALMALAQSHCENFIVLLKSTKDLKFRALYEHHTDRQEVVKLFASTPGVPTQLTCDVIGQFFKYNSGKKEFVAIDSRSFTMKTDACALRDEVVFKKKTALGKLL